MKKIIAIMFLLNACVLQNPVPQTTTTFKEEVKTSSRPIRARVADFFYPEVTHEYIVDPAPIVVVHPFCYKTWDKPVCYDQPELGQEARLVGERH